MPSQNCPWCQQRFKVADGTPRVRCPGCNRVVELGEAKSSQRWFLARARKKHGPYTWPQLQELAAQGNLAADDLLLAEGSVKWIPASTLPQLFTKPTKAKSRGLMIGLIAGCVTLILGLSMTAAIAFFRTDPVEPVAKIDPPKKDEAKPVVEEKKDPPVEEKKDPPVEEKKQPPKVEEKRPAPPTIDPVASFVQTLNLHRKLAGVGLIALDPDLSIGCLAHAKYLHQNPAEKAGVSALDEKLQNPGFSEQGKQAAQSAMIVYVDPKLALERWIGRLNTRGSLLHPDLAMVGAGFEQSAKGEWVCVLDALRGRGQGVVVYPRPDQDDVPLTFSGGLELPDKSSAGYPVTVTFPPNRKVLDAQAELSDPSGKPVEVWLSSPEKPAVARGQRNTIAMIAKKPLDSITKYEATVSAQVDGQPWTKTWTFATEDDRDTSGVWAKKALAKVNAYRANAGLNPVTLDATFSKGCLAHARYLVVNVDHPSLQGLGAHDEDAKLPGFTPEGRKAGKSSDIAIGDYMPLDGIDAWMATLYHRVPILEPQLKSIGFGCARGRRLGWVTVLDLLSGRPEKQPRPHAVFYPAPDHKDVPLNFPISGEEPNPIPLDKDGKAGYPITAAFPENAPLADAEAKLTDPQGRVVACWFSSREKPANPTFKGHQGNTICLIAHDPLLPSTVYQVELKGTLKGQRWDKTWQFTTASIGAGPQEAAQQIIDRVNHYRSAAGLASVELDPVASKGCQAHAEYIVRNAELLAKKPGSVTDEDPNHPGFTPEGQRAARQADVYSNATSPAAQIDDLMGTFSRRVFVIDPGLQRVGVGAAQDVGRGWRTVLDLFSGRNDQRILIYPSHDQDDVPCVGFDRVPDAPNQIAGYPITVHFPPLAKVTNARAVLKDADGKEIEIHVSSPEQPFDAKTKQSAVCVTPREPLPPGRTYTVTVAARVNNADWRRTWSFTTAPK